MDNRINPELFVICRLCIETTGQYQIVPEVKNQIEYCFDIQVDTFDGLSQVICKKCKDDLLKYMTLKNKFKGNQSKLLELKAKKAQDDDENNENASEESNDSSSDDSLPISTTILKDKKYKRIVFSDSESTSSSVSLQKKQKVKRNDLKKVYACRFCVKQCDNLKNIKRHYRKHGNLIDVLKKFTNIYCDVHLSKWDYDICDSDETVVKLNPSDIIGNEGNKYYYVKYVFKEEEDKKHEKRKEKVKRKPEDDDFDTSSTRSTIKKARLISNSSDGTVVPEDIQSNEDPEDFQTNRNPEGSKTSRANSCLGDCVDLGDTSSDSSTTTNSKQNSEADVKTALRNIYSINNVCLNKYHKCKKPNQNAPIGPVTDILDKKLLSIGSKIMSNKGFYSLGLLKYLERKHLAVQWIRPSQQSQNSKDNRNYVRILTKTKSKESHESVLDGWSTVAVEACPQTNGIEYPPLDVQQREVTPPSESIQSVITDKKPLLKDSAVLTAISTNSSLGNKLLNASPVTNPKKLPKKPVAHDVKSVTTSTKTEKKESSTNKNVGPIVIDSDEDTHPDENGNKSMPVITSVLSLAESETNDIMSTQEEPPKPPTPTPAVPRIKCKPVSELMARDTAPNNNAVTPTTNPFLPQQPADSSVVLNTVDIPNKKTNNPTQYLKTLLSMHSLVLQTNVNFNLTPEYHLLIKFHFEITVEGTLFCFELALYVHDKEFYLDIKNVKNKNAKIDIAELSAAWQMLVLKSFIGDVSTKIELNAAQFTKRGKDNVRRFLCLLKSIEEVNVFI